MTSTYRSGIYCDCCHQPIEICDCETCPTCGEPGHLAYESPYGEMICCDCAASPDWRADGLSQPVPRRDQ